MTQRFSVSPDPVAQNGVLEICYDFVGPPPATSPVEIHIVWDTKPPSEVTFSLSDEEPCTVVAVPPKATGGTLIDKSDQSEDRSITVTP